MRVWGWQRLYFLGSTQQPSHERIVSEGRPDALNLKEGFVHFSSAVPAVISYFMTSAATKI